MFFLKLEKTEKERWCKYHHPGCSSIYRVKVNAVWLSAANTWKHEQAKAKKAHDLLRLGHKYITEAVNNKTGQRHDLIDITTGEIYEFETDKRRAKRFEGTNINVIQLWSEKDG